MLRATEINAADPKGETDITAGCLMSLANLYVRMGRFAEAEPLLRHAVEIIEPFGPKLPYYAAVQHNLATFYLASGRYAEAEPIYKRLLKTYEVKYGPESTAIGMVLGDLAEISKDTGRYDEAGEFLQRALRIYEVTLRIDNPDVADKLVSLANLYAAQDRWDDAALLFDRARRVQGRFLNRTLSALAEDDQLTLLRTSDRDGLQSSLSLGLTRLSSTEDVRRSAAWVINGKAVTLNALAQRALLARDAVNPKASPIVRRLSDTRRRLSALTVAPFEVGQGGEGMRREIEHFSKQERELSRQLGQALGRPVRNDPWVELADVRIALPAGSTLVEFAKFDVRDFRAKGQERKWQPPRYAAWVIPPAGRGEIRLVDLGPAKEIEDAVAAARSVIQLDLAQFSAEGKGEPAAERRVLPPLKALGQLVLTPLLPHLAASTRWVLSPDAALWLIPWQALPLEDGRYAVEGHIIDLEVSGRDLVEPRPKPAGNPPVVVADPDFDASPRQARVEGERRLREQHRSNPEMLALRGLPRALSLGENAPRLPSTAAEAAAVTPALASYYKTEPAVYTGQLASETVFKAVSRPKALVLSTHGFFLEGVERKPDEGMNKAPGRPARGADGLSGNPLVRCGLLLAGCNQRRQVEPGSADEDGVLTGLEIVGSDLRGTDLVVLSACETGLGEVRNGEGVAGLRQAFQLAGAQAVVATLWQVPDKDSARLMKAFFDSMSTGGGKAEALRQAQLKQIASRREQYGAAHPFFWAAYTVTGDPGTGSH